MHQKQLLGLDAYRDVLSQSNEKRKVYSAGGSHNLLLVWH